MNLSRLAGVGVADSLIGPGDLLDITIATGRPGEDAKPQTTRVGADGRVAIPPIGEVEVGQLEAYDASQNITRAAIERGIYVRPNVTVEVKHKAMNRITVLGAVEKPDTYEIPRGSCDLAAAIALAGGLRDDASTRVEIMHHESFYLAENGSAMAAGEDASVTPAGYSAGGRPAGGGGASRMTRIDLASLTREGAGGDSRAGVQGDVGTASRLNDRDVVMVLPRDKEVIHVAGLVRQPGQFDLPHDRDVHLLDAVALGGGESSPVADKVLIIRRLPNQEPIAIRASLFKAKRHASENLRIAPGDTVSVERTPATVVVDTFNQLFRISVGMTGRTAVF